MTNVATIAVLSDAYTKAIQMGGGSAKTADSYAAELKVAAKYLGQETDIRTLTKERVQEFFDAPIVTQKRDGSPKNPISVAKTRRVLRLALAWAADSGWIDGAPMTAQSESHAPLEAQETVDPAADPVPDLPRFDHPAMIADQPVETPRIEKAKRSKKKAS